MAVNSAMCWYADKQLFSHSLSSCWCIMFRMTFVW